MKRNRQSSIEGNNLWSTDYINARLNVLITVEFGSLREEPSGIDISVPFADIKSESIVAETFLTTSPSVTAPAIIDVKPQNAGSKIDQPFNEPRVILADFVDDSRIGNGPLALQAPNQSSGNDFEGGSSKVLSSSKLDLVPSKSTIGNPDKVSKKIISEEELGTPKTKRTSMHINISDTKPPNNNQNLSNTSKPSTTPRRYSSDNISDPMNHQSSQRSFSNEQLNNHPGIQSQYYGVENMKRVVSIERVDSYKNPRKPRNSLPSNTNPQRRMSHGSVVLDSRGVSDIKTGVAEISLLSPYAQLQEDYRREAEEQQNQLKSDDISPATTTIIAATANTTLTGAASGNISTTSITTATELDSDKTVKRSTVITVESTSAPLTGKKDQSLPKPPTVDPKAQTKGPSRRANTKPAKRQEGPTPKPLKKLLNVMQWGHHSSDTQDVLSEMMHATDRNAKQSSTVRRNSTDTNSDGGGAKVVSSPDSSKAATPKEVEDAVQGSVSAAQGLDNALMNRYYGYDNVDKKVVGEKTVDSMKNPRKPVETRRSTMATRRPSG